MPTSIHPHALAGALDGVDAKILSLDCFDTLLWRLSHAPRCIFEDVRGGLIGEQRRRAESDARARARLARDSNEVTIAEIYERLLPGAPPSMQAAAVAAEIAAEARACFAFAPTVELMEEARRRGLQIIIVSDTYLGAEQLRSLITASAGTAVAALIDRIFTSCDHGRSKSEGLFRDVLNGLGVAPGDLLHIGDNQDADCAAPALLGIPSRHLRQFLPETEQRLRLEAATSALLHAGRRTIPAWQPHRAALAIAEPQFDHDALRLGFSVLGPLFTAFDKWLKDEAKALAAQTEGRVHALFLLRDGHLPHAMWEARGGSPDASPARVEISRFCATAASFRNEEDVVGLLAREGGAGHDRIARLLLLAPGGQKVRGAHPLARFLRPGEVRECLKQSRSFAKRLVKHVRRACDPKPGDTLMLVDLGYNGTVQNGVDQLLREAFDVSVAGRYLLLREDLPSGLDKAGMIDARHYDMPALTTLCDNIAALEQLATIGQGSVTDYQSDGTPIRAQYQVGEWQSLIRNGVQAACLEFARAEREAWSGAPARYDADCRREAAAAILARFLFLPLESELAVLDSFQHDVNLGGKAMVSLFDRAAGAQELRRRGLFYLKDASRMCLPAELRGQGLPLSLANLAQRRFGLDLRKADFEEPGLELPMMISEAGAGATLQHLPASRTHDGYLSLTVPVGRMRYSVGLLFGRLFKWVQLEAVHFLPVRLLAASGAEQSQHQVPVELVLDDIEQAAPGVLHCGASGMALVNPAPTRCEEDMVLIVVFRPILAQASEALAPAPVRAAA